MKFKHPLTRYRFERDLLQRTIASECGTSAALISRIEKGLQKPNLETAVAIEDATGITCRELLAAWRIMKGEKK